MNNHSLQAKRYANLEMAMSEQLARQHVYADVMRACSTEIE